MKHLLFALAVLLAARIAAQGQEAVRDGFENGTFQASWAQTASVALRSGSGATGTAFYAGLLPSTSATGRMLGARFDRVAPYGARTFEIDGYFRVTNAATRQFCLMVSDSANAIDSNFASINLRHEAGGWAAFKTSWNAITGLPAVVAGAWYRLRLTGTNWGGAGASYSLELSDADGTTFTSSAAGLSWFQNGNPSNNPARFFVFSSVFGAGPGFDVDDVSARVLETPPAESNVIRNFSGVYPHLAVFSAEGEAGMGAIAPWAGRLWFLTYPPHQINGSADRLWTVDTNLTLAARPESAGGTHANRMIHRESQQLILGPYFVDTNAAVRRVPSSAMPGRLTASARHLTDPTNQILFATMEDGFYAVDVNSLAVTTLKADAQTQTSGPGLLIPGNHGKGCYTAQGRVIYANNGETTWTIAGDPGFNSPAGVLTENTGADWSNGWSTVERKNFTEVTGPGGIQGATNTNDVAWALGWDKRSVLLKLLENGVWSTYRLPKGSYTHDAFLGWYTEWPRIRELTPALTLMHMHGLFYDFPRTFSSSNTAGLAPICTYVKMPVDYCWWDGRIAMGRDDASTTGGNIWAGQSHSAPWFGQRSDLEQWGAPAGFGGLWRNDAVTSGVPSEAFLVNGFARRVLHLRNDTTNDLQIAVEADAAGTGAWTALTNVAAAASGYTWAVLPAAGATWIRLVPDRDATNVTAYLHLGNAPRQAEAGPFAGLADATTATARSEGILRPQSGDARTLQFASTRIDAGGAAVGTGYYEIGGGLVLRASTNTAADAVLRSTYSLSNASFSVDAASVVVVEGTNRFRLPRTAGAYDAPTATGWPRGIREVVTERQMLNAHGTFYELPLSGSGGFRRIRPVATHGRRISDFASWRGLFVAAGVADTATNDAHVIRSEDGLTALWFGDVDDLWRMGAPAGWGGPWRDSAVTNGVPGDPFLMLGYDRKELALSHSNAGPVTFAVEVDFAADGVWSEYARLLVPAGATVRHVFPDNYSAHWVRLKADATTTATALFTYGPALSGYAAWSDQYALSAGPESDSDGDGAANLLEYATGSNPTNAGSWSTLAALRTNGVLNLLFPRSTGATDVTLVVEGAHALGTGGAWTGFATNRGGLWSPAQIESGTGSPVTVRVSDPAGDATNRFLRLRVTQP